MLLKWTEFKSNKFANLLSFISQLVHVYGAIPSMLTGTVVEGGEKSNVIAPGMHPGLGVRQEVILALGQGKSVYFWLYTLDSPITSHLFP